MAKQFLGASAGSALLDALVAGFAAAAVAFVAWAMPSEIFERLVSTSGLPAVLPAATPPLGNTARLGLMLGAASCLFVLLFAGLRLLGRVPAPSYSVPASIRVPSAPRLRRADAHPDAPSRAPISAVLELGAPMPPPWPEPIEEEEEQEPEYETEEEEPLTLEGYVELTEEEIAEPEPEAPSEPRSPPPTRLAGNESIAELMQRLERGLSVKSEPAAPSPPVSLPPLSTPPELDDRLRSAIEDLQRLAARS